MAKSKKPKPTRQRFDLLAVPPTSERIAKGEMHMVEVQLHDERNMATLDLQQTALDRFWRGLLLSPEGDLDLGRARYDAGTRLVQLYEATGYRQQVTGAYASRNPSGEMSDEEDEYLSANRRAFHGVVRMLGSTATAVVNLCVHERTDVDRAALIRGLDLLVRHWGLD